MYTRLARISAIISVSDHSKRESRIQRIFLVFRTRTISVPNLLIFLLFQILSQNNISFSKITIINNDYYANSPFPFPIQICSHSFPPFFCAPLHSMDYQPLLHPRFPHKFREFVSVDTGQNQMKRTTNHVQHCSNVL